MTQKILVEPLWDSNWNARNNTIGPRLRDGIRTHPNAADISEDNWEGTGRHFIALTNSGIGENIDYLAAVMIHSFIHTGGVDGRKLRWHELPWYDYALTKSASPSDLHYRGEDYDAAIEACIKGDKKTKVRKAKAYGIPTNPG